MKGRILRDLTLSDLTMVGPLILAVPAFARAAWADDALARWAWIAVGVTMLVVCGTYLIWAWRRRHQLQEETQR
ncbi:hypothetical protein AB0M02_20345 [Actinoplanes sp. NPDC051861]|uniref:hypothetical protein n=1 Tax=Actinoplanes sp. NPDC051861 TaxID=3155170 RepID=UPI003446EA9B